MARKLPELFPGSQNKHDRKAEQSKEPESRSIARPIDPLAARNRQTSGNRVRISLHRRKPQKPCRCPPAGACP